MDLRGCPDDWLEDIFTHLEYNQQCLIRRTCRRWNRVLRSPFVLRNMILRCPVPLTKRYTNFGFYWSPNSTYDLDDHRLTKKLTTLIAANSVQNVIMIGSALVPRENTHRPIDESTYNQWNHFYDEFHREIRFLSCLPAAARPRRLVLHDFRRICPVCLGKSWGTVFDSIYLSKISLDAHEVLDCLFMPSNLHFNPETMLAVKNVEFGPVDRLSVSNKPNDVFKRVMESQFAVPLSGAALKKVKHRWTTWFRMDPNIVVDLRQILAECNLDATFTRSPQFNIAQLDFSVFTPFVQRLLFCFQATNNNKNTSKR